MGPAGGPVLVELEGRPDARAAAPQHRPLPPVLVPGRPELARALRRALEAGASFTGASDHLVEALYLDDPEGNGIEIYRDRPRDEWSMEGGCGWRPSRSTWTGWSARCRPGRTGDAPGTTMGHVHLGARHPRGRGLLVGVVGFEPTVRSYPGALFVSAGGYHHHVGLNTWGTAGAPPPPEGARGLASLEVVVPGAAEVDRIEERARAAGADAERDGGGCVCGIRGTGSWCGIDRLTAA